MLWRKGLPVINPYMPVYRAWSIWVLLNDVVYTAFVVPIGVGFDASGVQWNVVGYFDFIAGKHGVQCRHAVESYPTADTSLHAKLSCRHI